MFVFYIIVFLFYFIRSQIYACQIVQFEPFCVSTREAPVIVAAVKTSTVNNSNSGRSLMNIDETNDVIV